MGNCCRPSHFIRRYSSRIRNRKIVLLLVGLDNAGKSCAAKGLSKEPVEDVVPTVGFNSVKLNHHGHQVIIYDLGGGKQIRGIWHRYFADVHGVIFVVDASDRDRLDECKNVLAELLKNEKLAGKPVLMLANKQDKEGALDELDIVERLNVEQLVNLQQCPTLVETCSAAPPVPIKRKRKLDSGINNGYKWLLRRIISDYDNLSARVLIDQEEQRIALALEREAMRIRIKEERRARGEASSSEDSSDHENRQNPNPNPFQPIHFLVEEKERKEKEKAVIQNGGLKINRKVLSNGNITGVIDLESPPQLSINKVNENTISAVEGVKEQFRQKSASQKKKRKIAFKNNKTAPFSEATAMQQSRNLSEENAHKLNELPPIKSSQVTWAQISSVGKANGVTNETCLWDLGKSLEVVMAPNGFVHRSDSPSVDSDATDVIVAHTR